MLLTDHAEMAATAGPHVEGIHADGPLSGFPLSSQKKPRENFRQPECGTLSQLAPSNIQVRSRVAALPGQARFRPLQTIAA